MLQNAIVAGIVGLLSSLKEVATPKAWVLVHHIVRVFCRIIGGVNFEIEIALHKIHKRSPIRYELELRIPVWEILLEAAGLSEFVKCVRVQVASNSLVAKSRVIFHHHVIPLEGIILGVLIRI